MEHPTSILRRFGGQARKRFGQHFLAAEGVVRRIVALGGVGPGSKVLEIGPGLGVMTELLLETGATVVAVELDRDMAAINRERFGDNPRFRLVEADAAAISDWSALLGGPGWTVVANLPYNVGTTILLSLLREPATFGRVVVMVQREVALRLVAPAGDRDRGSLSVFVEARAIGKVALKVPPGCFHPPPKVDSAVVVLELLAAPRVADAEALERVARVAFSAPRKSIRNPLSTRWDRAHVDQALLDAKIDPNRRPAELSLGELERLTACLGAPV